MCAVWEQCRTHATGSGDGIRVGSGVFAVATRRVGNRHISGTHPAFWKLIVMA